MNPNASQDPRAHRPRSLFWPIILLITVAGVGLNLHGAGLWLDLMDPQWVVDAQGQDVHISVAGLGGLEDFGGVLLAIALLIGLGLLMLVGLPLLLIGIAVLVVASIAMALLVPLLGLGALFGFPLLLLILPIWLLIQRDRRRAR